MDKWYKTKWNYGGGYLTYDGVFVARFKYNRGMYAKFKKFLMQNFTPKEYFAELDRGISPLDALRSKGFPEVSLY